MSIVKYYDMIWQLLPWWDCAGEDARKELLSLLAKRSPLEQKKARMQASFRKANYDHVVDYSNDIRRLGDCYVYAWISEKRGLFYIGSGDALRVINVSGRSKAFQDIIEREKCKVVLICSNIHKTYALEVEKGCVWLAQLQGANLINKNLVLSQYELDELSDSSIGDNPNIDFIEEFKLDYECVVQLMEFILNGGYDFTEANNGQQVFYRCTKARQ